jgi:hypothetical protein
MKEYSSHCTKLQAALICLGLYAQVRYGEEYCCTSQVIQV